MRVAMIVAGLGATLFVAGCATSIGSAGLTRPVDPAAIAVLEPGLIGSLDIRDLSDGDRKQALESEFRALEFSRSGDPVNWSNNWTGSAGVVVAAQPYRVGTQDCRPYSHTVKIAGESSTARGTACRNSDGTWTPLI